MKDSNLAGAACCRVRMNKAVTAESLSLNTRDDKGADWFNRKPLPTANEVRSVGIKGPTMRFFFKYNYIQVDNTCYKDLQTLASGYKVEYVLYIFISPAIFFYLFYLFLSFFALF